MKDYFNKLKVNSPRSLLDYFEKYMQYGFTFRNKKFTDLQPNFQENMNKLYKIRLGKDFIKSGYGVCWDFCELERDFFEIYNIEHVCYFIESYINRAEGGPTHTFAIFKQNDKWCWFEYSWLYYRGIWEYNSKEEALNDILKKFEKFYDRKLINIRIYKTQKVTKRLNAYEFVEHCVNGEQVEF